MNTAVMPIRRASIKVLPKQAEFIASTAKETLYSGAFGAGKSRAVCLKAVYHATRKGARVGLCRKSRASLTRTTLKTLLEPEGDLPAVLPDGSYEHIPSKSLIRMYGGGEIMYFGFDDDKSVASMNLSACGVDEAIETNEDEWSMLLGRIRLQTDPHRPLFGATNPGTPRHYLYNRFFTEKDSTRCLIQTRSNDNFFLPLDYLDVLNKFKGQRRQRYVEGKWVSMEGAVYDNFDETIHTTSVLPSFETAGWRFARSIDFGFTNPFVCLWGALSPDGTLYIYHEHYKAQQLIRWHADRIISYESNRRYQATVADHDAEGRAQLDSYGVRTTPAKKAVMTGISAVQRRFDTNKLIFHTSCVELIGECYDYMWMKDAEGKNNKEAPSPFRDHALDATRYMVMFFDSPSGNVQSASSAEDDHYEQSGAIV